MHGFEVARLEWYMLLEDKGYWTAYDSEEDAETSERRLRSRRLSDGGLSDGPMQRIADTTERRRRLSNDDCGRTDHASEFDLSLMFRDAGGDMLSKAR